MQFFKPRLLLMTAVALVASLSAASATQNDLGGWLNVTYQGHLSGDWMGWAEVQQRFDQDISHLTQSLYRVGAGYEIHPGLTVWAGYARVESPTVGLQIGENRIWQQVIWSPGKIFGGTFTTRTRTEERFVSNGSSTGYRLREFLRYEHPFEEGGDLSFIATSETFIALNDTNWGARKGFDQTRNFIGVGMTAFPNSRLEIGYLNQYINRIGPNDRSNHIISISLLGRF